MSDTTTVKSSNKTVDKPEGEAKKASPKVTTSRRIEKTVVLKASPLFITLPKGVQNETIVKFGSFFAKNSSSPARGLTTYEEELLLSDYLGTSANSPDFRKQTKEFWANIERRVPLPSGVELNISHTIRQVNIEVSKNIAGNDIKESQTVEIREPDNLMDFCIYQLAKMNEKVAITEKELESRENFEFYVVDLEAEKDKEKRTLRESKKGLVEYTKLINDDSDTATSKIKAIVNVFYDKLMRDGKYPTDVSDREDCEIAIDYLFREVPNDFLKVAKDTKLPDRALVAELLQMGIFREVGGVIVDTEENIIGDNMKEAVVFISNPSNSEKVAIFKGQLKEAKK